MKKKRDNFWSDGLSIDESKISCLIICLMAGVCFVGFSYLKYQDISDNLADIVISLIYGITGVNVASSLDTMMTNRQNGKIREMEMEHELEMKKVEKNNEEYVDI